MPSIGVKMVMILEPFPTPAMTCPTNSRFWSLIATRVSARREVAVVLVEIPIRCAQRKNGEIDDHLHLGAVGQFDLPALPRDGLIHDADCELDRLAVLVDQTAFLALGVEHIRFHQLLDGDDLGREYDLAVTADCELVLHIRV